MPAYRVSVLLELQTSVDVDDAESAKDATTRALQFVKDAIEIEDYAIDHIKIKKKTKASRLSNENEVKGKHGKTKKSKG